MLAILILIPFLLVSTIFGQERKLIFRQTAGAGYFSNNEWYKNSDNHDAPKYSRLGDLEKYRGLDESFHFILLYPELGRFNEWKQTSNPVTAGKGGVVGYQAINIAFYSNNWGGLEFNNGVCILDGSIDNAGFWYYAIGSFGDWQGGFPGPEGVVHMVELYIVVEDHLRFGPIFGSGMVLQANPQPSTVWGYGPEGDLVSIEVLHDGVPVFQYSDKIVDGAWGFTIPPQQAGTGYKVIVSTSTSVVVLDDVRFGEVWVCSGQSNMEFSMFGILDAENEMSNSVVYTDVRFVKINHFFASEPMEDLWGRIAIPWSGPENQAYLRYISAVCFLYGRQLYEQLQVPIGLVDTTWGGTFVEAWSSKKVMADCGLAPYHPHVNDHNDDSALWNAMVAPILKMSIKGAIWYQGESNAGVNDAGHNTEVYGCTFPGMVSDWRQKWHQQSDGSTPEDFPFGFVQLGTYREQIDNITPNSAWSRIRYHQTADIFYAPSPAFPNTFMSAAMDTHDPNSTYGVIHPRDKLTVANRLAWASLNKVYSLDGKFPSAGPQPITITDNKDGKITIEYDQPIKVLSYQGWQVCSSSSEELCNYFTGWEEVTAVDHTERTLTVDVGEKCRAGCTHLAYLWRETPCLKALNCPLYGTDQYRLPVTTWMWKISIYH